MNTGNTATYSNIKLFFQRYGTVLGGLLVFAGFALFVPHFGTRMNFLLILKQMSMLTILSLGFTFVMAAGGFDMSIGFAVGLMNVLFATILIASGNLFLAVMVTLGAGVVLGATNGLLVAYLRLPDFIATFAMGSVVFGVNMLFSGGHPVFLRRPSAAFIAIGRGHIGPIPMPVVIMAGVFILALLVLKRTRLGRHIYAIGGNPLAALYAGINVRRKRFYTFLISGLSIATTSIVLTSRLGSGQPGAGEGFLLDVISVCFLSTTMFGDGEPTAAGVFVGAFIITMLTNGLTMLGVPFYFQYITKGSVVILAVLLSVLLGSKRTIKLL